MPQHRTARARPRRAALLSSLLAVATLAPAAAAQVMPAPRPPAPVAPAPAAPAASPISPAPPASPGIPECLGFSFGKWTPALDARAAGHDPRARTGQAQAPGGRDWASELLSGRDSTLMLFPHWWPAGVLIDFRAPAVHGDTLRGRATALVADGRLTAPVAPVLAWGVPCGRPTAPPAR